MESGAVGGPEGPVERALARWVEAGLLAPELAETLRREDAGFRTGARRRYAQYVVAGTAGTLTLIAGAVFLAWSWPHLDAGWRTGVIGAAGAILVLGGILVERRPGRAPVGWGLQTAGLGVLLMAFAYSGHAWGDGTPVALALGALTVAVPLALAPFSFRVENPVMPAVLIGFGYAYLFVFLVRGLGLSEEGALWVVDGVLLVSLLALGILIGGRLRGVEEATPALEGWEVGAFTAALYAAPVLLLATGVGPLDLGDAAVFPLDLWWLILTALTLWAVHGAPPEVRRPWIPRQLAWSVVFGAVLIFWTIMGALDGPSWVASGLAGLLGGAALWHGLNWDLKDTVAVGCLVLVVTAWYFGADSAGALGAGLALAFTAALLFWVSGRLGSSPVEASGAVS